MTQFQSFRQLMHLGNKSFHVGDVITTKSKPNAFIIEPSNIGLNEKFFIRFGYTRVGYSKSFSITIESLILTLDN